MSQSGKMKPFSFISKKKELEAQKKFKEEQETAKVYEEFVSTFDQRPSTAKTFVLSSTISSASGKILDSSHAGDFYKTDKMRELDKKKNDEHKRDSEGNATPFKSLLGNQKPALKKGDVKKKTNYELFKEELKQKYDDKNGRMSNSASGRDSNRGHQDDQTTTNIYAGNINSNMTEQILKEIFGLFGSLASVKIMYPRTQEERDKNRGRLSGFIAFMFRKDAVNAMKTLDGQNIMDHKIKLSWGKAVILPQVPCYIPTILRPPLPELREFGLPFYAQVLDKDDQDYLNSYGDARNLIRDNKDKFYDILSRTIVYVQIPSDKQILSTINRVCEFVIREGAMFEANLMLRENGNPLYRFLFDICSQENAYYRWRMFSLLQGDGINEWRTDDFRMFDKGSIWRPPFIPNIEMTDDFLPSSDELRKHLKNTKDDDKIIERGLLYDDDREMFEDLLRNLTPVKDEIAELTVFCIDHAENWEEIVECLSQSLCLKETPLFKKLARLFLVSDILSNCTAKVVNVSYFRPSLQEKLISIFESLHESYEKIEGRLKADHFKNRILSVIRYWQETAMFHQDYLIQLQNIFLGFIKSQDEYDEDFDGIPFDNVPNKEHEDIDGVPIDHSTMFKTSKWETVADEQPITKQSHWESSDIYDDIDGEPLEQSNNNDSCLSTDGLSHDQLRNIEMRCSNYQDELEEDIRKGRFSLPENEIIHERVENFRRELIKKAWAKASPPHKRRK